MALSSKEQADYRPGKNEPRRCVNCKSFDEPHSCTKVEGVIHPEAVCDYFEQAPGDR